MEERKFSFYPRSINGKFEFKDELSQYKYGNKLERNEFGLSPREAFFNLTWHQALHIQGLIWYRNYLQEVEKNGKDFSEENNYFFHDEGLVIGNDTDGIRELDRQDDVYKIMVSRFRMFNSIYDRKPNIDELMTFINEQPPEDIKVSIKFSGRKAMELVLDDDKLQNRAALIRRFNRYFG